MDAAQAIADLSAADDMCIDTQRWFPVRTEFVRHDTLALGASPKRSPCVITPSTPGPVRFRWWRGPEPVRDKDLIAIETRIAVHEAVCAERYGKILDRVTRVEIILYAIVGLLLAGEESAIELLRQHFSQSLMLKANAGVEVR